MDAAKENPLTMEELKEYADLVNFNIKGMDRETAHKEIFREATSMLDHLIKLTEKGIESSVHSELMEMDAETLSEWRKLLVHVKLGLLLPSNSMFDLQEEP